MTVVVEISVSVDGFIAQPDHDPGPVHHWLFGGDIASRHNEEFKTSSASLPALDELFERPGALVVGRRTYDLTNGWGRSHPLKGVPMFVVTHRAPEPDDVPAGDTDFTFVTGGVAAAVHEATARASGKDVVVMGGASVIVQCLEGGLVDELSIHLAPVLLGDGVRLVDVLRTKPVRLEPISVTAAPDATHLRYRVV